MKIFDDVIACDLWFGIPPIKNPGYAYAGNYRPIAIASVVSKFFEHLILFQLKPLLTTSDNQFGFKPLHGTDMCTFLLKEVVRSYTTKNTPVYSVFLDASKAFDRVNHAMLQYFANLWPDPYLGAFYACFTSGILTKL